MKLDWPTYWVVGWYELHTLVQVHRPLGHVHPRSQFENAI